MADRGQPSIRANEVVPRPRGAHAAARQGRFRRSALTHPDTAAPASAPPKLRSLAVVLPAPTISPEAGPDVSARQSSPSQTHQDRARAPRRTARPLGSAGPGPGRTVRSVCADVAAAIVVAVVVPLALLQVPD